MRKTDKCVAKLGQPNMFTGMKVCYEPCEYLPAQEDNVSYSGWYHMDRNITHHAVPASLTR